MAQAGLFFVSNWHDAFFSIARFIGTCIIKLFLSRVRLRYARPTHHDVPSEGESCLDRVLFLVKREYLERI